MYYKYDSNNLNFKKIPVKRYLVLVLFLLLIFGILGTVGGYFLSSDKKPKNIVVYTPTSSPEFNEDELIKLIKKLRIKFPHIVLAQSKIETGHFKSKIFKENHNLFGLKEAKQRASTAEGTQYNHAYYEDWTYSVYDYALYSCRYLSGFKNEDEYLSYLKENYAEDPKYINKIKSIVKKENLKTKFEIYE